MKKLVAAMVCTGCVFLAADRLWSQESYPATLHQPAGIQRTAYDAYVLPAAPDAPSPSPSDAPVPQPIETPAASSPEAAAAPACPCVPCDDKPWTLPQPCLFQRLGITWGGWLQQGITLNSKDPRDRFNGPVATNDRAGDYQMNQLWLFFNRPVDTGGCGWDLGGRLDMIYGTDFRFGINHGLEDRINSLDQYYGLVLPQAYLEVGFNDWTVKLGHFAGLLSYEQVPAVANFFYSHSYSMGYAEPLLVTGMMATYKLCDHWSFSAGFHRGWMMWEDFNDKLNFMGAVTWTSDKKNTSLTFAADVGEVDDWFPMPIADRNRFAYSVMLQQKLGPKWRFVLQHDLGIEEDAAPRTGQDAQWYSVAEYLFYKINPCWEAGLRAEWFRDADGARVAGVGALVPGHGWSAGPGFAGDFHEVSLGLNWRPNPNVLLRPELRWDWYDGTRNLQGQLPFDAGTSDNQFLFAVDLIVTY